MPSIGHPGNKQLGLALARLYASRQAYDEAEAELNKILADDPGDQRVRATLGDLLVAQGATERAEKVFQTICDEAPQTPAGYLKLSQLFWREDRKADALTTLEAGYRKNPTSVPLFSSLVRLHLAQNQADQAAALCQEAIDRVPQSAFPYNALGNVLTIRKDYPNAIEAFNKAIAIQPLWQPPHNGLARVYLLQGNTREAIDKLKKAIQADPKNQAAFMTLANLYEQREEYDRAMAIYRQALKNNPDMWPAANNLAFLITEADPSEAQTGEAALLAMQAFKMQPENPMVLDTLGWVYYRQGNLPQALVYTEEAVDKEENSPILNYHLAAVLHASGRILEAKTAVARALADGEDFHGRGDAEKLMQTLAAGG